MWSFLTVITDEGRNLKTEGSGLILYVLGHSFNYKNTPLILIISIVGFGNLPSILEFISRFLIMYLINCRLR